MYPIHTKVYAIHIYMCVVFAVEFVTKQLDDSCLSYFYIAGTKYLTYKLKKRFILAKVDRGFSPWTTGFRSGLHESGA